MMGKHAVEKKKVEDRIELSKGMRQKFLSSRLKNRKTASMMNRNGSRVAPELDGDGDGECGGGSGGGDDQAMTSSGRWFGVIASAGVAADVSGNGTSPRGHHVVDIQ
jgi:hypothetical protein